MKISSAGLEWRGLMRFRGLMGRRGCKGGFILLFFFGEGPCFTRHYIHTVTVSVSCIICKCLRKININIKSASDSVLFVMTYIVKQLYLVD